MLVYSGKDDPQKRGECALDIPVPLPPDFWKAKRIHRPASEVEKQYGLPAGYLSFAYGLTDDPHSRSLRGVEEAV